MQAENFDSMQYQVEQTSTGGSMVALVINLVVMGLMLATMWKLFTKAGQPGWACLVPIYNAVVLLKMAGKPVWWLVLMFIPLVNIIVAIITTLALAKAFGKGTGFGLGMVFLGFIFYPLLAFGDAEYQGAEGGAPSMAMAA